MTIAEAAHKCGFITNLEYLLDVFELEGTLAYVVLRAEWVVDARHGGGLVDAIRDARVEVVGLVSVKWSSAHDTILMELQDLTVVVQEVKQNIT